MKGDREERKILYRGARDEILKLFCLAQKYVGQGRHILEVSRLQTVTHHCV